jgi:hypothetical protein
MRRRTDVPVTPPTNTPPAPGPTPPAAAQAPAGVACPDCFQVGEHLDGCPNEGSEIAAAAGTPAPAPTSFSATASGVGPLPPARTQAGVEGSAAEGTLVEVTWGQETFQAFQYTACGVGPFRISTMVQKGETIAQAMIRLHEQMTEAARTIRDRKLTEHVRAQIALARSVEGQAAR